MTIKEFILATFALVVLIFAQMGATHASALLHQAPWLDEVHTGILVNEPDAQKFRSAVSDECVDANFPVYYDLLRTLHLRSLAAVRVVSLMGTIAALLGIYVLLRGSFKPIEAAVGVLAVWSIPLVVYQTFQARFYAPWFAAVVWFAVAMRWTKTARMKWLAGAAVGVTSLLSCTLLLLGLPAVGLIVLAEILADRAPLKTRIIRALPSVVGLVAILCFIPLMIEQRNSFQIKTWLVGNPLRLFYSTVGGILPGVAASAIMLALFASAWFRKRDNRPPRDVSLVPLAGASSLILFPLALLAVTIASRPVLLPRYAIICATTVAAASGFAASRMRTCAALIVCLILIGESSAELSRRVREAGDNSTELNGMVGSIRAEPNEPALFESRHQLFPVVWEARDLVDRCAYVDFDPGTNQPDPVVEGFERDLAKKFQHIFGWPRVISWDRATSLSRFLLFSLDNDRERIAGRFDGYKVEQIGQKEFQLTRNTAKINADESIFFKFE